MKTNRGFELQHFSDDYGLDCSIQESSSIIPHVWLGVHRAPTKIMRHDAKALGFTTENDTGWMDYSIPDCVMIESRMHLNQTQARELAKKLLYFAEHGSLKEETDA